MRKEDGMSVMLMNLRKRTDDAYVQGYKKGFKAGLDKAEATTKQVEKQLGLNKIIGE